jgi:hypothetical protein
MDFRTVWSFVRIYQTDKFVSLQDWLQQPILLVMTGKGNPRNGKEVPKEVYVQRAVLVSLLVVFVPLILSYQCTDIYIVQNIIHLQKHTINY